MQNKQEINPFGRIHDYISIELNDDENNYFRISDGTTTILLDSLIIEPASNFSKPHIIRNSERTASMMLTNKQMLRVLSEYARYFGKQWEDSSGEPS